MHYWLNCPRRSLAFLLVLGSIWGEIAMASGVSEFPNALRFNPVVLGFESEKLCSATPCVEPLANVRDPALRDHPEPGRPLNPPRGVSAK